MGCLSCGNGGNVKVNKQFNKQVELTMIEYFVSLGWVYSGMCGCRDNHKVYQNASIPNFEVWIHQMGNTMKMKRVYSPADKKTVSTGGLANFKEAYDYAINTWEHKIT